jgi:lipopolysaccharide/colanic/teichoic acid biosynthesis glycosyltransferase
LHLFLLGSGLLAARLLSRLHETRREIRLRKATNSAQHVLVVQATRLAWFFTKLIEELLPGEYQIVAVLDERPALRSRSLNGYPIVGSPAHIENVIDEYGMHGITIDRIVVGAKPEEISLDVWEDVSRVCKERSIELDVLPNAFMSGLFAEADNVADYAHDIEDASASIDSLDGLLRRPYWAAKRVIDFTVAGIVAILALPLALLVFVAALLDVGMPVIFWQQRVGRDGTPLHLYKFRTLQTLYGRRTPASREAQKPSPIGRFLRKTRLDELPQLWNILSGDMSLIGPRPLLPIDQPDGPSIRLSVRPGLSGWAQVCGGKLISVEEKNALDEWYIRYASSALDVSIVVRTIGMFFVGDRRDEKAIATALAERYQSELATLTNTVPAQKTEHIRVLRKPSPRARRQLRRV